MPNQNNADHNVQQSCHFWSHCRSRHI